MKKTRSVVTKFNFNWQDISPKQIKNIVNSTDMYNSFIICGADNNVASKSVDDDNNSWQYINSASDGSGSINKVKSVKTLAPGLSIFTSGDGYFIANESSVVKKTAENSLLPSNNVNKVVALLSDKERYFTYYVCTDKGLYNGFIGDDIDDIYKVVTSADGLPSDNVRDFSANNNSCIYVTDQGLAISHTSLPLQEPITQVSNIDFINNNEFLFAATQFETDALNTDRNGFIAASLHKVAVSFDNGKTWKNMTPLNLGNREISCVAIDDCNLYVGTNDGLFISHKNRILWSHYTKLDGLLGNQITDIAIDALDGKCIIVATENGLNQGYFFKWSMITIPGVNQIFSLVNVVDGLETKGVFYAGTDKGLYKSQDDCLTWQNVYDSAPVLSLASSPFYNGMLFVGTKGDGLLIYLRAKRIDKKTAPDYHYTTGNGLLENNITCITAWTPNAFSQKIFVGYQNSPQISYTNDYSYQGKWATLNENEAGNKLPLSRPSSMRILNDKLYICSDDHNGQGAFLAVSQEKLSLGDTDSKLTFKVVIQDQAIATMQDVALVNGKIFVTSMNYKGSGAFSGVDIRFSPETDLLTWTFLEENAFYGDGFMATDKKILYIYELNSLVCYDPESDEQKTYPLTSLTNNPFIQPAPLIHNDNLYLIADNKIYYSTISKFI